MFLSPWSQFFALTTPCSEGVIDAPNLFYTVQYPNGNFANIGGPAVANIKNEDLVIAKEYFDSFSFRNLLSMGAGWPAARPARVTQTPQDFAPK